MAQTYDELQQQIHRLQQRAEALRASEVSEVVDRIKVAIAHYSLTAEQLGFGVGKRVAAKPAASPVAAKKPGTSKTTKVQFGDSEGNVWGGRGPRPAWLRMALQAGHDINEFRIGRRATPKKLTAPPAAVEASAATAATAPAPSASPTPKKSKRVAKVQYSDGVGHAWSGMGPKPGWLKAAIEAGHSLSDFAR